MERDIRPNLPLENMDLYEVDRETYSSFVNTIRPETRLITYKKPSGYLKYFQYRIDMTSIYSAQRNVPLCSRVSYPKGETTERYFIWNLLADGEGQDYAAVPTIVLNTPEQVQRLCDYIKEQNKTNG